MTTAASTSRPSPPPPTARPPRPPGSPGKPPPRDIPPPRLPRRSCTCEVSRRALELNFIAITTCRSRYPVEGRAIHCRGDRPGRQSWPVRRLAPAGRDRGQPVEHAGLGEQGEPVGHTPVLDDPAVDDPDLVEHGEADLPSAGWAEKRAGSRGLTVHPNPESIPDLRGVLDGEPGIGEGAVHVADGRLHRGDRGRTPSGQPELVLDDVRRAQLVDDRLVPGGEAR